MDMAYFCNLDAARGVGDLVWLNYDGYRLGCERCRATAAQPSPWRGRTQPGSLSAYQCDHRRPQWPQGQSLVHPALQLRCGRLTATRNSRLAPTTGTSRGATIKQRTGCAVGCRRSKGTREGLPSDRPATAATAGGSRAAGRRTPPARTRWLRWTRQ